MFVYHKSETFSFFNNKVSDNIIFYNDAIDQNAICSVKFSRFIINKDILKENFLESPIFYYDSKTPHNILVALNKRKKYLNTIKICMNKNFSFFIIRVEEEILILTPIGENLYQIVYSNFKKYHLNSVLCSFFKKYPNLYIDITKYKKYFSFSYKYHLFEAKNYFKDLNINNIFIKEHLISNWVNKPINKKNKLFIFDKSYFIKDEKQFNKPCYQNKKNTNCFLLTKENLTQQKISYKKIDLITFNKATKKVSAFKNFSAKKELSNIYTFNGYCIGIEENGEIIAGACIEKIGVNYAYISYVFTIDEKQKNGYGTKLLKAIENECFYLNKKIMLICYNPIALKLYLKNNFSIQSEMMCPDIFNSKQKKHHI